MVGAEQRVSHRLQWGAWWQQSWSPFPGLVGDRSEQPTLGSPGPARERHRVLWGSFLVLRGARPSLTESQNVRG